MLEPSASRFWQAATQSGLIAQEHLQACWDSVPPDKREPDAIDRRLARQAVQGGLLTLWQAQQLMTGRSTGFKIDRYVLLDLIGQGGMGRVYLARDTRLNRKVALKILSPERMNNPRARERFHREARAGAQLQHEHLVRIYDQGESAGKCYLVMEFIEGKNIGQMIAETGVVPPPVAARLTLQVALGLEHAQRKGLIHRDVNPYNILVTQDGQAKLTDLGLALDLTENDRVTRDGATVGTFDYVSPEQARHSHDVDTRSDIYSLGCSLYHMLTGVVPFPDPSLPQKLYGHQALEPEPIEAIVPNVPSGLSLVIGKMMKKSRDDRYSTPLEVAQALGPFADDSTELDAESALLGHSSIGKGGGVKSTDQTITNYPVSAVPIPPPPSEAAADQGNAVVTREPTTAGPGPGSRKTKSPSAAEPIVAVPGEPPADPPDSDFGGLGISVDLGPERPLTAGLSSTAKPKTKVKAASTTEPKPSKAKGNSKAKTKAQGKATKKTRASSPLFRQLLPPVAAGLILAILAGGFWAYQSWRGTVLVGVGSPGAVEKGSKKGATDAAGNPLDVDESLSSPTPDAKAIVDGSGFLVVASDGSTTVEPDLPAALRSAIGAKGYVLLANQAPIEVPSGSIGSIGGGVLAIRAAKGTRPVLRVEVKGRTPFLATRGDTPLRLEGITIVARYNAPDNTPEPNPVIDSGSHVTLNRCAFRLEGESPANSRALMTQGGIVSIKGTSFENFGSALQMTLFAGTIATFQQCLFARPPTTEASTANPTSSAISIKVSTGGTSRQQRKVVFERCTVVGQTFLALRDFAPRSPTTIELVDTAIKVNRLIRWGAVAPPSIGPLKWSGKGNRYDVEAKPWIMLTPKDAAETPMPDGPADLSAWNRFVNEQEVESTAGTIAFADASGFAISEPAAKTPLGADPKEFGPAAPPVAEPKKEADSSKGVND